MALDVVEGFDCLATRSAPGRHTQSAGDEGMLPMSEKVPQTIPSRFDEFLKLDRRPSNFVTVGDPTMRTVPMHPAGDCRLP